MVSFDILSAFKAWRYLLGQAVVHFEIGCRDSARANDFYSKLFDWKVEQMAPAGMIDTLSLFHLLRLVKWGTLPGFPIRTGILLDSGKWHSKTVHR